MTNDPESDRAAAHLYRLAQATALLRAFKEGGEPELGSDGKVKPTEADFREVEREHPDLVALANRSNPFLSGAN